MNKEFLKDIRKTFVRKFAANPVLSYAPGRINLIGEHTDYNGGYVFPAAIDKGVTSAVASNGEDVCRVYAMNNDEYYEFDIHNISSIPNGGWRNYVVGVTYQLLKLDLPIEGFNLVFAGDVPVGSGLSSSAALENSIVVGLNSLFDLKLSKEKMIRISQQAEHEFAGVQCGIMDQYASMFGKENHAFMLNCDTMDTMYVKVDLKEYELVLINSKIHHELSGSAYNERRELCESVASKLEVSHVSELNEPILRDHKSELTEDEFRKALYIIMENERVQLAFKALKIGSIISLGSLMYASHHGLQYKYEVSCPEIDFLVDAARKSGVVIGSRIMGGGFGGCTLNLVHKGSENELEQICLLYKKEFNIAPSFIHVRLGDGAKILENE